MNALAKSTVAVIGAALVAFSAHARSPLDQSIDACKSEVSRLYMANGNTPRVAFSGTRGAGKAKKIRIRVYPESAPPFNTLCQVDRESGMVTSVTPSPKQSVEKEQAN
jgi:hypothetical protein